MVRDDIQSSFVRSVAQVMSELEQNGQNATPENVTSLLNEHGGYEIPVSDVELAMERVEQ